MGVGTSLICQVVQTTRMETRTDSISYCLGFRDYLAIVESYLDFDEVGLSQRYQVRVGLHLLHIPGLHQCQSVHCPLPLRGQRHMFRPCWSHSLKRWNDVKTENRTIWNDFILIPQIYHIILELKDEKIWLTLDGKFIFTWFFKINKK